MGSTQNELKQKTTYKNIFKTDSRGSPKWIRQVRCRLGMEAPALIKCFGRPDLVDISRFAFFCPTRCDGLAVLRAYDIARLLRDQEVPVAMRRETKLELEAFELLSRGGHSIVTCHRSSSVADWPAGWFEMIEGGRLVVLVPSASTLGGERRPIANSSALLLAALSSDAEIIESEDCSSLSELKSLLQQWTRSEDFGEFQKLKSRLRSKDFRSSI